ncbi:unnamed protein product, partial [Ectocarpus sp. 8 AP-2014]
VIFDAVRRSIDAHGAQKFTMSHVAQFAGLTRVQLYNRFGSRDALILALLVDHVISFKRNVTRDILAADDLVIAIREALIGGINLVREDPYFTMLIMPAVTGQTEVDGSSKAIMKMGREQWVPIAKRAIDDAIFKADLVPEDIADWLTFNEMTLLNAAQTYGKSLEQCRVYFDDYILPSLLSQAGNDKS